MFFGWAAPLPLYILLTKFAGDIGTNVSAIRWMKYSLWGCLLFGILAYPFFLVYGYHPVEINSTSLPLSVIMSGLVMVTWYIFMGSYLTVRSKLKNTTGPWFEASLVMLFICSLGAWGVALVQAIDPMAQLMMKALTHFFLATFTEGWVLLVVLAIVVESEPGKRLELPFSEGLIIGLITIGAPLTFPYGIAESMLTPQLLITARLGGCLIAAGVLMALYPLLKSGKWKNAIWIWPLGLLLLKVLMQLGASVLPSEFWLADHPLRILYLHVLLLGALTLTCVGWMHEQVNAAKKVYISLAVSVGVVLLTLVMMTRFWPASWSGMWIFYLITGATLLPVAALIVEWLELKFVNKKLPE